MDALPKLGWATLGILCLLKWIGVYIRRGAKWSPQAAVFFWLLWPGVDPRPFLEKGTRIAEDGEQFAGGLYRLLIGACTIVLIALASPVLGSTATTWLGIFSLLLCVHMGLCVMVPVLYRLMGFPVPDLFDRPWAATRLIVFWSKHWNLAYVEMNRFLFLPAFRKFVSRKAAIYLLLIASGVLHELAISFPAGAGWGLPFLYFCLQAGFVGVERKLRLRSSLYTYACFLLPLPILFHEPFRGACVKPLFTGIRESILSVSPGEWLNCGIVALGVLQFAVLTASLQVPARLRWREELPRLSRLNERLVWTYGAFILVTIVAIGSMTFVLREEFVAGDRATRAIALFTSVFWGLRLAFDRFWIQKDDWPPGASLKIGHALLSTLFITLFFGYGFLALRPDMVGPTTLSRNAMHSSSPQ